MTVDKISPLLADIEARLMASSPSISQADGQLWRDRKSARTRTKVLDAAVACLAQYGYAKTSTQTVAATAQLSRGAMLHHYRTKAELMAATIDYIYFKRLEAFHAQAERLSDAERMVEGAALEIYWQLVQTPEYDAYMEVCMAARTDEDLAALLADKMRTSNDYFMDIIPVIFPEWAASDAADQQLALDLVVVALDGLRLNAKVIDDRARRIAIRKLIFQAVQALRQGSLPSLEQT